MDLQIGPGFEWGWTARIAIARHAFARHFWQQINCSTQILSFARIQLILAKPDSSKWQKKWQLLDTKKFKSFFPRFMDLRIFYTFLTFITECFRYIKHFRGLSNIHYEMWVTRLMWILMNILSFWGQNFNSNLIRSFHE